MATTFKLAVLVAPLVLGCVAIAGEPSDASAAELPEVVSFNESIRPIFTKNCMGCHGGPKQAAGLSLIYRESALDEAESGRHAIVPGKPDESYLVERVADTDSDFRMPPADHGPALSDREVALLRKWIEQGAKWEEHWSFIPPQPVTPPTVKNAEWPREPLDRFVLAKLEAKDLVPSAEVDRGEWLRRVTFDLIGLPPTVAEVNAFAEDTSADAYEKVVDRLLASSKFGERWAAVWLDLSRYADTMGYEKDPHRDMWPYRDWLIRALNADIPYDEFTIKQLAGDLLPEKAIEDRVATGFHRNTQNNTEGGTDDEEFRVAAVMDRASTTWQVWGATTFGCVQCHAHPYDPIKHEEYYEFLALFDDSRDADVGEEWPWVAVPLDTDKFDEASRLDREIAELKEHRHQSVLSLATDLERWQPLAIAEATSTGQTRLATRVDPGTGAMEIVTRGTVSNRSMFTISLATRTATSATALRVDVLPKNVAEALKSPEQGFVLTRLRAWVDTPDGQSKEVFFCDAISDDAHPQMDPLDVSNDNNQGWAAYTKINRPRWAVFVFAERAEIPAGAKLRLQMKHERDAEGSSALVINRAQFSLSNDPAWTALSSGEFAAAKAKLQVRIDARNSIKSVAMPVMAELPADIARETYVFERGNWLSKGAHVTAGTPEVFPPLPTDRPADRLAMARWLVSGEHPLTSRVMVNRLWEHLFGIGIVETSEDFGSSGTPPSHPELLDYLALRFQNEHAWHVKPLLRELVLSATYRQTSRVPRELAADDPQNRLLGRGPRNRLTAEMVRDQALQVSGLLSDKMFGPSVMPPQPEGVWRSVYNGSTWKTATGEDRYRRAIYTYWKRTSGYPSMMTFDAPSREVCTVRRVATNTPLQALVTLNDPAFVECATALARRAESEGPNDTAGRIGWIYLVLTGETIRPATATELLDLFVDVTTRYDANDESMTTLGATPEQFALVIVANTIQNLDEALTK